MMPTMQEIDEWEKKIHNKIFQEFVGQPNESHWLVLRDSFSKLCAAARRGVEADKEMAVLSSVDSLQKATIAELKAHREELRERAEKAKAELAALKVERDEAVRKERDIAEALSKSLLALGWVQNHPDFGPFANRIHEAVADAIQAVEREIDAIRARPTEPAASPAAPRGESE